MNSPVTARRGNLLSAGGMAAAVIATLVLLVQDGVITTTGWIVLVLGAATCRPLAQVLVAAPDDPLIDVLTGHNIRSDLILGVEHDQLVGIVTSTDIAWVMELAALRHAPPHRPTGE